MSKATAREEIPALAKKNGFYLHREAHTGSVERYAFMHGDRLEGFILRVEPDGPFISATYYAKTEFRTIVEHRAPGEYGKRGESLGGNSKRRPVGMDDVRADPVASPHGLDVGYLEVKRRIRSPEWREELK